MSDNDLIRRGDARKMKFADFKIGVDGIYVSQHEFIKNIKAIPVDRHEMSARELFNAYQRICEEYSHKGIPIRCDECPLFSICPEIGRALRVMVIWSTIIERWAREHPEERSEE